MYCMARMALELWLMFMEASHSNWFRSGCCVCMGGVQTGTQASAEATKMRAAQHACKLKSVGRRGEKRVHVACVGCASCGMAEVRGEQGAARVCVRVRVCAQRTRA
jgi:hypothetical protein